MDLHQNQMLNRAPKRQRTDEEGEDQVQRNYSRLSTSWGQLNHDLPAAPSLQVQEPYGISPYNFVPVTPNGNPHYVPLCVDTIDSGYSNGLDLFPYQLRSTGQLAHRIPNQADSPHLASQAPAVPSAITWPLAYHDPLHAHVSNHPSFGDQSFVSWTWIDQPTGNLQQGPDSFLRHTLPPSQQCDGTLLRDERFNLPADGQPELEVSRGAIVCFGMVSIARSLVGR
jgi:hypothetical protein